MLEIFIMVISHSTVGVMHHDDYRAEPAGPYCELWSEKKAQPRVISINNHTRIETSQLAVLFLYLMATKG